jgi:hypothetical protein
MENINFTHNSSEDVFGGMNHVHFSKDLQNYVVLPIIPPKETTE